MIEKKMIDDAKVSGFIFICSMCEKLHMGNDQGRLGQWDNKVCSSLICKSVHEGGSFDDYSGPLEGYLIKYCHFCGMENPEKMVGPKNDKSRRVGCCNVCVKKMVKIGIEKFKSKNIRTILSSERKLGKDLFDVFG